MSAVLSGLYGWRCAAGWPPVSAKQCGRLVLQHRSQQHIQAAAPAPAAVGVAASGSLRLGTLCRAAWPPLNPICPPPSVERRQPF